MGLLRWRGSETTSEDFFERRAEQEKLLLDAIGDKTDALAGEALRLVGQLPEAERQLFMKNIFRQLVAQSLLTAEAFDEQHISRFGYGTHRRLGSKFSFVVLHHELRPAIIDDSLPRFEQEHLGLDTSQI